MSDFIDQFLAVADQPGAVEVLLNGHYFLPAVEGNLFIGNGGRCIVGGAGLEGRYNHGFGLRCLTKITVAKYNTAFGFEAMEDLVTGDYNTGFGEAVQIFNIAGHGNTSLGWKALMSKKNVGLGSYNTAAGYAAGICLTSGEGNVILGMMAMGGAGPTGSANVAVGRAAGYDLTEGGNNIFVGFSAGRGVQHGAGNVVIGAVQGLPAGMSETVILATGTGKRRVVADAAGIRFFAADGTTVIGQFP